MILIGALLTCLFAGCGVSGIPLEQYEQVRAQLADSQAQLEASQAQLTASQAQVTELQSEIRGLEEQNEGVNAELEAAQSQVAASQAELEVAQSQMHTFQAQIAALQSETVLLREQAAITGATPAETAEKIVKKYHETHVYSKKDFFICSNMALDVWNMLQAQGINAVIRVGDVETGVGDIAEASHAWVLAEVSPGQYLALEVTGGYVVPEADNALYYRGWTFDSPKEYREYEELRREWNIRVDIINKMISEAEATQQEYGSEYADYQGLVEEFNQKYAGHPPSEESENHLEKIEAQLAIMKEKEGRCNQLEELIVEQQAKMENIVSEMSDLTG